MQREAQPLAWRPRGLSDTVDGSTSFNGAMSSLANLIPDVTTSQSWQCRPAATQIFSTSAIGTLAISCFRIVGNILYGMVGNVDGKDHPFAMNLTNNTAITVAAGGTGGTIFPTSQPQTGPWTPPQLDLIGNKLVIAHSGFGSTASFIGWFDVSTPTAPTWNTGNLTGAVAFTVPPISVAQFNGRAYYIENITSQPAVIFSDVNNAINVTAATQVLTFGDNTPLTALGQLRLYNQLGGIIQALIVFKDSINVYQVTGDASGVPSSLAVNAMNFATGTKAPNSVCSTPRGLAFVAPDGLRIIDFSANISDPIGYDGQGVVAPFIFSNVPSRIFAACNGNIIRVTTQNQLNPNNLYQEYWYDLVRKVWSGPHTCPAQYIQPFGGTFITSLINVYSAVGTVNNPVNALLFQSDTVLSPTSVFIENTVQLKWMYNTDTLPDTDQMGCIHVSQALLDCAFSTQFPIVAVSCTDQNNLVIDSLQLTGATGAGMIWGSSTWGAPTTWGFPNNAFASRKLPWHFPLVFNKAQFNINGTSAKEIRLGALHFRYKQLRYLTDILAAA